MCSNIESLLIAFHSTNTLHKVLKTQNENENKYLENKIYGIIVIYVTNVMLVMLVEISK
jgi:hypothetical protein